MENLCPYCGGSGIVSLKTIKKREFINPYDTKITLLITKVGGGIGHPYGAERLVGGYLQQGSFGCNKKCANKRIKEWAKFEDSIGSVAQR